MIKGFTCGSFDLFHAGHMLMLREIRSQVDYLIVGLQSNPSIDRRDKNTPILSVKEREILLHGCRYIDHIWIYDTESDLYEYLKQNRHQIDKRFIGQDWSGKRFTGHDLKNMEIVFNSREHTLSTTELRNRVFEAEAYKRMFGKPILCRGNTNEHTIEFNNPIT